MFVLDELEIALLTELELETLDESELPAEEEAGELKKLLLEDP